MFPGPTSACVGAVLCLIGATSAQGQDASPGLELGKKVTFLGFSADESLSAWRVEVRRQHEASGSTVVDRYALIRLVDNESQATVGTFRASGITRRRVGGKGGVWSRKTLLAAAPDFASARPEAQWRAMGQRLQLSSMKLAMKDSTVRLQLDDGLELHATPKEHHLEVQGPVGSPVGFRPMARLLSGELLSLGHYQVPGQPHIAWVAHVTVYHSKTAKTVAVLCDFFPEGDPARVHSMGAALRTPEAPLGTNAIGTMKFMHNVLRRGAQDFEELLGDGDPEVKEMYRKYIGDDWY